MTRPFRSFFKPEKVDKPVKKYQLKRTPIKKKVRVVSEEDKVKKADMDLFFLKAVSKLTGICQHCGGPTERNKASVAHIVPKAYVKSVATHDEVWIELCMWSPSCHGNLDRGMLPYEDLKCWDEVLRKFLIFAPLIPQKEYRFVPDCLLQYIEPK